MSLKLNYSQIKIFPIGQIELFAIRSLFHETIFTTTIYSWTRPMMAVRNVRDAKHRVYDELALEKSMDTSIMQLNTALNDFDAFSRNYLLLLFAL